MRQWVYQKIALDAIYYCTEIIKKKKVGIYTSNLTFTYYFLCVFVAMSLQNKYCLVTGHNIFNSSQYLFKELRLIFATKCLF